MRYYKTLRRLALRSWREVKLFDNIGERVLALVSGGKDSALMYYLLNDVSEKFGLEVVGFHLNLGIGKFSEESEAKAKELFERVGGEYYIKKVEEVCGIKHRDFVEYSINTFLKRSNVCNACSLLKRYCFYKVAIDLKVNSIATAHTLEDFARLILSFYIHGNLKVLTRLTPKNYSAINKNLRILKPLYLITEDLIIKAVEELELPYVKNSCPYSKKHTSETSRILECIKNPGNDRVQSFVLNFIKRVYPKVGGEDLLRKFNIKKCKKCGMPTGSRDGICLVCKIKDGLRGNNYSSLNRNFSLHSDKDDNSNN